MCWGANGDPLEVIEGCSCILGELNKCFVEDSYSHIAIDVISCLIRDAVSIIEDEEKGKRWIKI